MKFHRVFSLFAVALLAGCATLPTPQQRQQTSARQQAATRMVDEKVHRMQGRVESVEMENARLIQELQQLRNDVRSYNSQIAQLNASMKSLEGRQSREMQEMIRRVEGLLKKSTAARPASKQSRGAGREHVVESGHTLSAIAQAYGTTVKAIKAANHLQSDSIYIGQKLFIPE